MIQFNVLFSANFADGFYQDLRCLKSSFSGVLSFFNSLARLVRTTSVKFIGLFPQYVTEWSVVPSIFRLTDRISFFRGGSSFSTGSLFSRDLVFSSKGSSFSRGHRSSVFTF